MPKTKEPKKDQKKEIGITIKKEEEFGEWFSQIITKAELVEYTDVSGCYVFRPNSYSIWEKVQAFMDSEFRKLGVRNAYFPLFIPEKLLNREKEHVEGFTPEVAWVTHTGESKLSERLAIRPTSETIMYDSYKKWIRSWRDLPLKINQWCNVVRWEFKNPVPFIRSREFLWQEGHTAHRTKDEAEKEVFQILDIYEKTYNDLYAMPCIKGFKTEKEKFAGALYTTTIEIFLPNGKSAQACTSHCLGQNFAKAFDISFLDEKEEKQHVWQNSWGYSTRSMGIMICMHSDNKGLVLPPRVASTQAVIVPITFADSKEKVLSKAREVKKCLESEGISVVLDDRDELTPGWKFNEWEMKGIPLRIEVGPKDVEKDQAVIVRRDNGKKDFVKTADLGKKAKEALEQMHKDLYDRALRLRQDNEAEAKEFHELTKAIKDRKLVKAAWCSSTECEEMIKDKTGGAKIICIPFGKDMDRKEAKGRCVCCGKPAKYEVYIAKSY
ncbi:proline--tRNA ligase [Candidatus Woesearchaeota archaeon CG10_big_fil_rev_8_21_14_0_10_44_13]|nr:MAG: proline--tRNA ligase [Candidatus Woesearchaeota archaeon CG10_big_fil_rev_8_21_14_0_10_44_13]